jgi:hypothetical protein
MARRVAGVALALLVSGCESTTRVDCPALEVDECLEQSPACVWARPRVGGDCRNACESDDDCDAGLACVDTVIYDGSVEAIIVSRLACSSDE